MSCKQTYPFPWRESLLLLYNKLSICLEEDAIYLFSEAISYTNIHEKIIWNKIYQYLCLQNMQKHKNPQRIIAQHCPRPKTVPDTL